MRRRSTLIIGYTIVCLTRMVRLDRIEVSILDNFSLTIFIVSSLTSTEKERTMTEMKNNIRQRPPDCNRPECSSRSQAQAERDASARRKQLAQRVQYDFHPLNGMFVRFKALYVHFKAIVKQMGRPEVRFHDVRHTYATLSLQSHVDPKTLSEALGHATVAFTLDVYGHSNADMRQQAADQLSPLSCCSCRAH